MRTNLRLLVQDLHEIAAPPAKAATPPAKKYRSGHEPQGEKQAKAKADLAATAGDVTPAEALTQAKNPSTPTETLKALAAKFVASAAIQKALARNPNIDSDTLAFFAQSHPIDFLLNPGLPLIVLEDPAFLQKLNPDTLSLVLATMQRRQKKQLALVLGTKQKSLSYTKLREELLAKGKSADELAFDLPKTLDLYATGFVVATHYPMPGVKAEPVFYKNLKHAFGSYTLLSPTTYEGLADKP